MEKVSSVEEYYRKDSPFQKQILQLREWLLETELTETLKWNCPVYTFQNKNVVGLARFKNHYSLWFYQGALMQDPLHWFHYEEENKPNAMRQLRFTREDQLDRKKILSYVNEALFNQKEGKEIKPQSKPELPIPEVLKQALENDSELKTTFERLSKSCRNEYSEYISTAKKEETQLRRLEKIIPMILEKKGLNDPYRNV